MGWLSPIIVKAKILMQGLWLCKLSWDDELNPEHRSSWEKWVEQLPFISGISIPRWNYFHPSEEVVEAHVFADASKLAYGAALYLRVVHNGEVFVSLQTSKVRLLPSNF